MMKYYGVHKGHKTGVFKSWTVTKPLVEGYEGAVYKSFFLASQADYFAKTGTEPPKLGSDTIHSVGSEPSRHRSAPAPKKGIARYSVDELRIMYHDKSKEDVDTLFIYTDGSTINNGRANAKGGYGVFFSDPSLPEISAPLKYHKVTNNTAELTALISAFKTVLAAGKHYSNILVYSDSKYSAEAITVKYKKWELNGWQVYWNGKTKPVENVELIKEAHDLFLKLGPKIKINHIYAAHDSGKTDLHSIGNQIADRLADWKQFH